MSDYQPGGVANAFGDLYGTSPLRVIASGRITIDRDLAPAAQEAGWRIVEKDRPDCDDDYVWMERTWDERSARAACRQGILA